MSRCGSGRGGGHRTRRAGEQIVDRTEQRLVDRAERQPMRSPQPAPDLLDQPLAALALHQQKPPSAGSASAMPSATGQTINSLPPIAISRIETDDGEHELACRLHQHIDDDARGGERAADAAQRKAPRADEIAADLGERQQRIGALADETQADAEPERRPLLAAETAATSRRPRSPPRRRAQARTRTAAQPALTMACPTGRRHTRRSARSARTCR